MAKNAAPANVRVDQQIPVRYPLAERDSPAASANGHGFDANRDFAKKPLGEKKWSTSQPEKARPYTNLRPHGGKGV